jgi:hypothetical protein
MQSFSGVVGGSGLVIAKSAFGESDGDINVT